ncbi:hypothetical protein [Enterobacter roggenkampii]|uniref:hypothetical protein n=1 Tax=Enterobacter roggenkampii TaxID=1812935 RepID=UPI002A80BCF4|nr:hypothetical protein [Enterobacter roggenkampii]
MTTVQGLCVGDIVTLRGEDGEWLVESIIRNDREQQIVYYNEETGDFIQMDIPEALAKLDVVLRKGE